MTKGKRKSWREKLNDSKDLPRVVPIDERMGRRWGHGTMVLPAPQEVDELMRKVPRGKVTTVNQIRETLARRHGATISCPMVTGIFVWVAANAAEEAVAEGAGDINPYWRTLKSGGELNQKYPGGVEQQALNLMLEGHEIEPGRGRKSPRVKGFESSLAELD